MQEHNHQRAEIILKAKPMLLSQIQYCEDKSIPHSVVIGESELEKGVVQLRNTVTREQVEVARESLVDELARACAS